MILKVVKSNRVLYDYEQSICMLRWTGLQPLHYYGLSAQRALAYYYGA
jgi:hypothetical protein